MVGAMASACASGPDEVVVEVDPTADVRPISPYIYGVSVSEGAEPHFEEMGVSVVRWGGNARSRFNWEINASNAGDDWYFQNVRKGDGVPGSAAVAFHSRNQEAGADSLLTIPMIGWVAKDRDEVRSVDVPTGRRLNGYDPAANRLRTSVASFARKGGPLEYPPDRDDGAVYQAEWVHYLTQTLGPADGEGIRFYEMGNEPMLWSETHRDVSPDPIGYAEYLARFLEHANALKDVDPAAQILGPSVWGWTAYFYAGTRPPDGGGSPSPVEANGAGLPAFLPWFLREVRKHDDRTGRRSLDYLDVHYYSDGGVFSSDVSAVAQARRLRSTRSLWDDSYRDESWIADTDEGPYVRLIPRLREWIDEYYRGTKLSISEWTWGGRDHISGGLAAADVLGIFGREGVDLATYWGDPGAGSPVYWAFRMFRDYDGHGGAFGDTSVRATSSHPDLVAAYASIDSETHQLKLMLINKSPEDSLDVRVRPVNTATCGDARVYRMSEAAPGIVELAPLQASGGGFLIELAPYSLNMAIVDLEHLP